MLSKEELFSYCLGTLNFLSKLAPLRFHGRYLTLLKYEAVSRVGKSNWAAKRSALNFRVSGVGGWRIYFHQNMVQRRVVL